MRHPGHSGLSIGWAIGSLVFTTVLTGGPLSRGDVAHRTGLSAAAVAIQRFIAPRTM
jgi:hypothetical protein